MNVAVARGPVGNHRGVGFGILMYIVTLGFYSWYWVYQTQEEIKRRSGDGVGGVIGLVIWIVFSPIEAFVIPAEIGRMYRGEDREAPVNGWTGLWLFPFGFLIVTAIVWFVKMQRALNTFWETAAAGADAGTAMAPIATADVEPTQPDEAPGGGSSDTAS